LDKMSPLDGARKNFGIDGDQKVYLLKNGGHIPQRDYPVEFVVTLKSISGVVP
jgi:hypothetical protein